MSKEKETSKTGKVLHRRWGIVVMAAGFLAVSADAVAQQRPLVVSQSSDVLTLDPSKDTSPIGLNLFKNAYEQLTNITVTGDVEPLIATSWAASPDSKVWTFKIRDGLKFHDGSPLTAEDVAWTYQKILDDKRSPNRGFLRAIASVEKVDDSTVRFNLKTPFSPFHRQVSLISVMPKKTYESIGEDEFAKHPVGSGPYKIISWVKDDKLTIEAFDGYWGKIPKIKTVIMRPVPSESARVAALISGDIDIVPILPPALVQRLERVESVRIEKVAANRVIYLGFNVNNVPFDDIKLRKAIDHAIDRTAITQRLLRGLGIPEGQVVAPVTFGYDPSIKPTSYDPEMAKKLVKESGYDGSSLLFQYPNNRYAYGVEVAQAVGGYLNAAGIKVNMQGMEYSAFIQLWFGRKLKGMHMFGYGPSIMDAQLPLGSLYQSNQRGYWTNQQVDDLVEQQQAEPDSKKRAAIISKVWKLSKENATYAVLYNEIQAYGVNKDVKWSPRPDERLIFRDAEFID